MSHQVVAAPHQEEYLHHERKQLYRVVLPLHKAAKESEKKDVHRIKPEFFGKVAIAHFRLEQGEREKDKPDYRRYLHRDRPVRPLEEEREDKYIERAANYRIYDAMIRTLRQMTCDGPAACDVAGKRDYFRNCSSRQSLNLRQWRHSSF